MLNQKQYEKSIATFPDTISAAFKDALRHHATFIELNKSDILINDTPNNQKIYYIIQGSLVRYIITPDGNERAVMFHTESFLPNVSNIFVDSDNSDVRYLVKANEHTQLFYITADFGFEWIKDSAFIVFIIKRALQFHGISNQLQNHLIGLSSEAFFEWLIKKHNFLFQRFLSKDIASFMGVSPTWLSLIKAKKNKK